MAAVNYRPTNQQSQMKMVSGEDPFVCHNFEEFRAYRDITFFWKYLMCSDEFVFPPISSYEHPDAHLSWETKTKRQLYGVFDNGPAYKVIGFRKRSRLLPIAPDCSRLLLTAPDCSRLLLTASGLLHR